MKKIENPTDAEIEEVFKSYKAEVQRIFDTHSKRLLAPDVAAKGFKVIRIGVDEDDRAL